MDDDRGLHSQIRFARHPSIVILGLVPTIFTQLSFGCVFVFVVNLLRRCFFFEDFVMNAIGLGRFGDRRLEKGGSFCTIGLLRLGVMERMCVGLAAADQEKSGSRGFCAIVR